ncbi:MAG: protein kinase [Kofleriaceae bacterium]|nr:protein kinase [Kofleriaceae bacterium]
MEDHDLDTLLAKLAQTPQRRTPLQFVGTKRFELRRKLGSGGFGDVYEARDREHGTIVALKALRSSHPDWIYRFKREFRIVGDLAHPNLVRLYELFVEDERWYLTMEMIEGLQIGEHLRRAPDQLRSCFGQLALGISELHRARCIHRDLKPSNVLVEATGRVVLLDFGLAVQQRMSQNSALSGTPPYMAPELGIGRPPSEASDWYAFGVMLYEALSGVLPFMGNQLEMLQAKLAAQPVPPRQHRAGVDEELEALALQLLARDPHDRPTTAGVLAALIGNDRASQAIAVYHAPRAPIVGRQPQLERLEAALAQAARGPTVVTVRGAPGMGKTSVVSAFAERARKRATIYQGRCLELESVPFKGLDSAIDAMCSDLSRRRYDDVTRVMPRDVAPLVQMFPMFKRVEAFSRARPADAVTRTPQESRQAASRALRELVTNLAGAMPVVLAIDDFQWTSDDTKHLLLELLAAPAPRVLLILVYRDEPSGAPDPLARFLEGLAEVGLAPTDIDVPPLDVPAIEEWLGASPERQVTASDAMRETGGHPYLLARWLEHGARTHERPPELTEVLAAELGELDERTRDLLDLVSIAGGPVRAQAVFGAAGMPSDLSSIDQLRRRKLLLSSSSDQLLETYHNRVREAALAAMSAERRRALHLSLAHALEDAELAEPEALARHFRDGGDVERALAWTLRAAAHAAALLAFARTVELFSQAMELAPDRETRLELLQLVAEAQVQYGRRGDAARSCEAAAVLALELGRTAQHAALRARAGEHYLLAGQYARGFELLRDALAAVGVTLSASAAIAIAESINYGGELAVRGLEPRQPPRDDPRLRERVDLVLAVARPLIQTDLRGPTMASRGLLDALELGEPQRVQRALAYFVINHATRMPDHPLMVEAEARVHALAAELGDELAIAWAEMATGMRAMYRHEFGIALASLAEAERRFLAVPDHAREAGLARLSTITICGNYFVDPPYARRRHEGFTEAALARGDVWSATWSHLTAIYLDLTDDDPAAARAHLDAVHRMWPEPADSLLAASVMFHEIAIVVYEAPARAWDAITAMRTRYHQLFTSLIPTGIAVFSRLAAHGAVAAYNAGQLTRAQALAELEPLLPPLAAQRIRAVHDCVLAHVCALRGDPEGSLAARDSAIAIWHGTKQAAMEHAARLRRAQLAADTATAEAAHATLRALGVRRPERFADVVAGPLLSRG